MAEYMMSYNVNFSQRHVICGWGNIRVLFLILGFTKQEGNKDK